jgi:Uma2 family endonuclease
MMNAVAPVDIPDTADQRVFLSNVTWKDYEVMLALRGDNPAPRFTYLEGVLEIMSPSIDHEYVKTTLARLIEAWSVRAGTDRPPASGGAIRLNGYGSWTLKDPAVDRGLEPDECYVLGRERKGRPDLAIEVVWTRGGIRKLDVYRGLGVGEVWLWKAGALEVHVLVEGAYEQRPQSALLPAMDLAALARFATVYDQFDALEGFLASTR